MIHLAGDLIDYEDGVLSEEQTIELFRKLIETGMIWNLQGHYQRTAEQLGLLGE
jgi:hypothetical protein